jgi:hypothetical protein
MTTTDMLAIARAATPGEWDWDSGDIGLEASQPYVGVSSDDELIYEIFCNGAQHRANARHIATFSPARVIALLEFVQAWDALEAFEADDETPTLADRISECELSGQLMEAVYAKRRALDET